MHNDGDGVGNGKKLWLLFFIMQLKEKSSFGPVVLCPHPRARSPSRPRPRPVVVGHARMRRPFELAGVNARCKSGAELFLPTSPPAVAIMHYYYPGTPLRRPCRHNAGNALCIYIFFPGRRSCWKLLLEINFVQLKHLIFTNSLIDFTAVAAFGVHFAQNY